MKLGKNLNGLSSSKDRSYLGSFAYVAKYLLLSTSICLLSYSGLLAQVSGGSPDVSGRPGVESPESEPIDDTWDDTVDEPNDPTAIRVKPTGPLILDLIKNGMAGPNGVPVKVIVNVQKRMEHISLQFLTSADGEVILPSPFPEIQGDLIGASQERNILVKFPPNLENPNLYVIAKGFVANVGSGQLPVSTLSTLPCGTTIWNPPLEALPLVNGETQQILKLPIEH